MPGIAIRTPLLFCLVLNLLGCCGCGAWGSGGTVPEGGLMYRHTGKEHVEILWLHDDDSYTQVIVTKAGDVYQKKGSYSITRHPDVWLHHQIVFRGLEIGSFFPVEEMRQKMMESRDGFIAMPFSKSSLMFSTPGQDPDNADEYLFFRGI